MSIDYPIVFIVEDKDNGTVLYDENKILKRDIAYSDTKRRIFLNDVLVVLNSENDMVINIITKKNILGGEKNVKFVGLLTNSIKRVIYDFKPPLTESYINDNILPKYAVFLINDKINVFKIENNTLERMKIQIDKSYVYLVLGDRFIVTWEYIYDVIDNRKIIFNHKYDNLMISTSNTILGINYPIGTNEDITYVDELIINNDDIKIIRKHKYTFFPVSDQTLIIRNTDKDFYFIQNSPAHGIWMYNTKNQEFTSLPILRDTHVFSNRIPKEIYYIGDTKLSYEDSSLGFHIFDFKDNKDQVLKRIQKIKTVRLLTKDKVLVNDKIVDLVKNNTRKLKYKILTAIPYRSRIHKKKIEVSIANITMITPIIGKIIHSFI